MSEFIDIVLVSLPVMVAPFLALCATTFFEPAKSKSQLTETAGVWFLAIVLSYVVLVMDIVFGAKHMPLWENVLFLVIVFFMVLMLWTKFGPG